MLLINDETRTFSTGPGGATRAWGLEPDLLDRGIVLTPFHNMELMSPLTTRADVKLHYGVFSTAFSQR